MYQIISYFCPVRTVEEAHHNTQTYKALLIQADYLVFTSL